MTTGENTRLPKGQLDWTYRYRACTTANRPGRPDWAEDVEQSAEDGWISFIAHLPVPGFEPIEIFQIADEQEDGTWVVSEPRVDVTEFGIGDPVRLEVIADAIELGRFDLIDHFLQWNEPLEEGRSGDALSAYVDALRRGAALLRAITPDREETFPIEASVLLNPEWFDDMVTHDPRAALSAALANSSADR